MIILLSKHKQAIEHLERVTGITVSLKQELQNDKDKLSKDKADYEKDNTAWLDQSSVISTEEKNRYNKATKIGRG